MSNLSAQLLIPEGSHPPLLRVFEVAAGQTISPGCAVSWPDSTTNKVSLVESGNYMGALANQTAVTAGELAYVASFGVAYLCAGGAVPAGARLKPTTGGKFIAATVGEQTRAMSLGIGGGVDAPIGGANAADGQLFTGIIAVGAPADAT